MDLHVVPYTAIYFAVEYPTGVRDNFIEVLFSPMSLAHCLAGENESLGTAIDRKGRVRGEE